MKVTLIHNSKAGDDKHPSKDVLLFLIEQSGYEVNYQSTKHDKWVAALENPGDLVIAAGGDGTVGQVAQRLVGQDIPMAVLPMGTANNIAKTLGLMDIPLEQLVEGWATAPRIKFDSAIASGAWGTTQLIESLGMGLFARTMSKVEHSGHLKHVATAEEELATVLDLLKQRVSRCPARSLTLSLDGQDISGEYILLEVMNIEYVGPNLHLAPNISLNDGLLTVVLVREGEQDKITNYLSDCLAGKCDLAPFTQYQGRHLQIQGEGFDIHVDDKILSKDNLASPDGSIVIDVSVAPQSLEFLLPKS
ncbi:MULTISPECIES: diacylglycerol/lipid kinase family protein [Cyanophyceae]|uniref:NAD(+)/NADH kinase n=1 Tax=Leptolyngbya subtilissima DQ-A4 TaxID=2933933 RepID=A0ABV0K5S4_9CYAN|nr:diacylglycerol kinase family protein [Nodosilinea sp. FACHB-141]MBD2114373.1 NAD(+)/NADH kinase [Nodosilinea sp. FACHB-141]